MAFETEQEKEQALDDGSSTVRSEVSVTNKREYNSKAQSILKKVGLSCQKPTTSPVNFK
jgi:hypothetical protein